MSSIWNEVATRQAMVVPGNNGMSSLMIALKEA